MRRLAALLVLLTACATQSASNRQQATGNSLELPHRIVTLDNGLTLVMQPDAAMPVVGVEVWIRGGSREEGPGQHGIAHLFEHNIPSSGRFGSNPENRAMRAAASRASGAGTQPDFLRFYNHSTPEGLEATVAALADRIESDPAKFSEEAVRRDQDIVVSELRRSVGGEWDIDLLRYLHRGTFGADHPYGHATSGSEADVRAATAETMRDWHRRFAGASNTAVFLVGNFDPAEGERIVRHHFGSIAPGLRAPAPGEDVPPVKAWREWLEKPVQRETVYRRWPIPGWGTADADLLTLFARMLGHEATVEGYELAGAFTWRGGEEELGRRLRDGITEGELARAKAQVQGDFVRMLQRPVWRGSRADVLGFGLLWRGNAEHYKTQLARLETATAANVTEAARRWLGVPGYVLHVVPPRPKAAGIDRSASVRALPARPVEFPTVEMAAVNGVRVLKVQRDALPLAQLTVAFDAGTDVEGVRETLQDLGAEVTTGMDADFATVSASVLAKDAQEAANVLAYAKSGSLRGRRSRGTPVEERYRVLECLVADCEQESASGPRVFIASGDVRGLQVAFDGSDDAPAAKPLRVNDGEQFHIIDSPAATQAHILLAQVLPPAVAKDPLPAHFVVSYLFRSRLMDNLRSSKGWSYEIYPFALDVRRGGAVARFNIPVQTEKTAESIVEIRKEMARLQNEPATSDELAFVRGWLEGGFTGGLMSLEALNAQLLELARNDLPPDYYRTAIPRLQAFTAEDARAIARELLRPERLIWIIAGPRAAIEGELRELGVEVNSVQ